MHFCRRDKLRKTTSSKIFKMHSKNSASKDLFSCSLPVFHSFLYMYFHESFRLQEDKMIFELNLEIQFLLKQGQVEVDMGEFIPDFSDSVLIHRSRIEELNSQIKVENQIFTVTILVPCQSQPFYCQYFRL